MNIQFLFVSVIILSIILSPIFYENSYAQQEMSPHQQWKEFADLDMLTCKQGHLLLQKSNGIPVCVMPLTYMKLVDRKYGVHNTSLMSKHPDMLNHLMQNIASNETLMSHWHEMMQKNPSVVTQTIDRWISQMKKNPDLMNNMLSPMTSDPKLREKMIELMKSHPHMENSLKQDSKWMDSIHHQMMGSEMGSEMNHTECKWCPDYEEHPMKMHSMNFSNSDKILDMIHHMWINPKMSQDMHTLMLENPFHMAYMSEEMMEPILNAVMDDKDLRQQMIELMLEHQDFMNAIRHKSPS